MVSKPITNYEYEINLNEQKRRILILKPQYLSLVVTDLKNMMKYNPESASILDQKQSKPTQEEIDAEIARLQQYYQSIEYQKNRSKEYPLLGDQLDMLWHAIDQGNLDKTSNFYLSLKQIKDKYPKG